MTVLDVAVIVMIGAAIVMTVAAIVGNYYGKQFEMEEKEKKRINGGEK